MINRSRKKRALFHELVITPHEGIFGKKCCNGCGSNVIITCQRCDLERKPLKRPKNLKALATGCANGTKRYKRPDSSAILKGHPFYRIR